MINAKEVALNIIKLSEDYRNKILEQEAQLTKESAKSFVIDCIPLIDVLSDHIYYNGQEYVLKIFAQACENRAELFAKAMTERDYMDFTKEIKKLKDLATLLRYIMEE